MPWFKKGPDDRTLVFDTFLAVEREWDDNAGAWRPAALVVRWPNVSLERVQRETLARILANLNTLGRSESWCEAELADGADHSALFVCRRLQGELAGDHEIVRLLCPDPASALSLW